MTAHLAIVTGGNRGLGLAIARKLAALPDTHVIIAARKIDEATAAADSLPNASAAALDVGNADSVRAFGEWLRDQPGQVRILVNNAGVNPGAAGPESSILTADPQTALQTWSINTLGALRVCQTVIPLMQAHGSGRVVNVSTEMASLSELTGDFYPLCPSYRLSKAGLNALTRQLARELSGTDVLVNAYSPGWMKTDMGGADAPFTADEGAETALWLATLPTGGSQGGFFAEPRRLGPPVKLPW